MFGHLTDMARDGEELKEAAQPMVMEPDKYPYGLRISLTHHELEKLGVDHSDWEIGAVFHLMALAKVVSISSNENASGEDCCVGLQITHLAGPENEEEEGEGEMMEDEEPDLSRHGYFRYGK